MMKHGTFYLSECLREQLLLNILFCLCLNLADGWISEADMHGENIAMLAQFANSSEASAIMSCFLYELVLGVT